MQTKIGIVGFGEIGSSVEKLYLGKKKYTTHIKDLDRDDGLFGVDYMHICIPYSEDFVDLVCAYIQKEKPKNVIINSTIVPGTTRRVIDKSGFTNICHSPVRGVHPNLYEGLKAFEKYVSVLEEGQFSSDVSTHFSKLGIQTKVVSPPEVSELAKIASTTYYGLCIAWHGEMNELCSEYNVDFEDVMTNWNLGYNEGYRALGMPNVARPVLYPPSNKIGGHCVIPNARLMKTFFDSKSLDLILKYQ